ncbi:MAG: hypothetical protein Kow00117_20940 [Phototrophicales bacterium]
MPGPTLTFAFIVATLFGTAFHLIRGGDVRDLAAYLLAGWVGFVLGHIVGVLTNFGILNVGSLKLLPATIGALSALIFMSMTRTRK